MNKAKLVAKMYKEVQALDKRLLPVTLLQAISASVKPFVNIWFTAKLLDLLEASAPLATLFFYIGIAVALNFVLFFLTGFLDEYAESLRGLLLDRENRKMAEKLYETSYATLEDSDFKALVHKHDEAAKSRWARFPYFIWTTLRFLSGLFTLVISVVIILPLLKIGFTATGSSFFERPVFLVSLLGAILLMAAMILAAAVYINRSYLAANEAYAQLDRIFYCFLDIFGDYRTGKEIRLYKEQPLIDHIATEKILTEGEKTLRRISMRTAKTSSFVAILGAVVGFGVYLFIGVKGLFGLFGIGSLVLYCGSFMQIINGIMLMANTLGKLAEILPLAGCYFSILGKKSDMRYGDQTPDLNGDFEIECKDVSFRYPKSSTYALRHVDLHIRAGEHLAVVGRNGSGKTTLIKLLCRLYDVTEGEILINGVNIREFSEEGLRRLWAVVFQDFQIFSVPAAHNVAASDRYDEARLHGALEKADCLARIQEMPQGAETYLYKDLDPAGVEISGGEAQKLALARALYKDAPIVILDEPTAALDPIAEHEIYSRFHSFVQNKTAIYISHRLSSCVFCDKIAVFDHGRLVETGTHTELLQNDGQYAKLWNAQAQYYR